MSTVEHLMDLDACRFRVPGTQGPSDPEVVSLPVVALRPGRSFGEGGFRDDHVAALKRASSRWTSIAAAWSNLTVLDGWHRLVAARRLVVVHVPATIHSKELDQRLVEAPIKQVGASPETVRGVRAFIDPVSASEHPIGISEVGPRSRHTGHTDVGCTWLREGATTAEFIERTNIVNTDPNTYAGAVPT